MNAQEARKQWKLANTTDESQYVSVKNAIQENVAYGRIDFPQELGISAVRMLTEEGYKVLPSIRADDGKMFTPVIWFE